MKSSLLLLFSCFVTLLIQGQNINFDSLHYWKGDILDFDWKQNEVKSIMSSSGSSLLYFESNWKEDGLLNFKLKLPFSPSSNNVFELLISSDSLFVDSNLILLKIGESGSNDGLDVFKGQMLELTNAKRNWGSGGSAAISIVYKNDSLTFFEEFEQDSIEKIGVISVTTLPRYVGLKCKYTKSNASKFTLKDLFFGLQPIDSIPPKIVSIEMLAKHEICVFFNEKISDNHLNYQPIPENIVLHDSSVVLKYKNQEDFSLSIIDSLSDIEGNISNIDTTIFINYLNKYDLIISEIMVDPDVNVNSISDEYLELYNRSNYPLSIVNVMILIDSVVEKLPDTVLDANSYLVIFPKKSLINSGSEIKIISEKETIHKIDYNLDWYKDSYKKLGGWSMEMIDVSKPCLNIKNWEATINFNGGTPGLINSVNRMLKENLLFEIDRFFPVNDTTIQIVFNYSISNRVVLDSIIIDKLQIHQMSYQNNEVTVFTEQMKVDSIYSLRIEEPIYSCWKEGYIDSVSIKYALPSILQEGDVIINEILFDPDFSGSDYIEVFNKTKEYYNIKQLQLGSYDDIGNISDVHFLTKEDRLISPFETIAFSEDIDWIKLNYEKYGNILKSELPACNNNEDNVLLMSTQGKIIDSLFYSDSWHYSELNSSENVALERISPNKSNNAVNWFSASSASGYGTPGLKNSAAGQNTEGNETVFIENDVITPNNDGVNDFLRINFNLAEVGWIGSIKIINSLGITIHTLAPNILLGPTDIITWNCNLATKSTLTAGIYVLLIQMIHPETGNKFNQKITFYINRELK
jgi:hypothetical protein